MHDEGEDKATRGLPWSFVLDPVANARTISDVQRRGVHAAKLLVDQVVSALDRIDQPASPGRPSTSGPSKGPDPTVELVQAWSRLVSRTLESFVAGGGVAESSSNDHSDKGRGSMIVDVVAGGDMSCLCLDADEDGSATSPFQLRLRNPSTEPVGPLHFHLGDLRSPEGHPAPSSVVAFEPAVIDELGPGASHSVVLTLSFVEGLPPGVYRSVIQIAGAPHVSIPLRLSVHPMSS